MGDASILMTIFIDYYRSLNSSNHSVYDYRKHNELEYEPNNDNLSIVYHCQVKYPNYI
jgi:hypothetical protein